ncbi:hypothetical protein MKX01_033042 [Papaver californicum]|nr:hypothetical protein MKX01_033042 [Papaver californicum]
MGAQYTKQVKRRKAIAAEKKTLEDLEENSGDDFLGSDYHPSDRKNWMSGLDPSIIHINKIVWPGTHDSATNKIGIRFISLQEDHCVCHGILLTYGFDVVVNDIKKFLSETESEIIILEVRKEFGHEDPPEFDKYLEEQLGEYLVHQDDHVFGKTIADLLPKRVICVWKPRNSPAPNKGSPLWSSGYLKANWIDTDLPATKFESNMEHLREQPPVSNRKFFYRVDNTVTPQADNPVLCVKPVTGRIHGYARLFIVECFSRGFADRLQVYSTDFIDEGFVDACGGLTKSRLDDDNPQVSDI